MKPKSHIADLFVYEPGRPIEEVAREVGFDDPSQLVKLASNENPLGPSPKAIEAMRACASEMHLYPDGGCFYLRQGVASHWGVKPEELIFGAGSNEIIELLGHVFLEPGTNIVMSEQAFIIYHLIAAGWGAETRFVPSQNFAHDLDAMLTQIDEQTRIVFVANPNNPTGTVLPREAVEAFVAAVPEHVLVVLDEAYIELIDAKDQPAPAPRRNLMRLRTFSKSYGLAGLRIGYGMGHPEVIQWLEKFRQPFNVTAMAQQAALAALSDYEHLENMIRVTRDGLEAFTTFSESIGIEMVPSVANFVLLKTGDGRVVFEQLKNRGVIVRPMDGYGLPEYIRVSIGLQADNEAFFNALDPELLA